MKKTKAISVFILLICLCVLGYTLISSPSELPDVSISDEPAPPPLTPPVVQEEPSPTPTAPPEADEIDELNEQQPDDNLPHDKLFITPERQKYKSGELTLIIPRLDKELSIYSGVGADVLSKGVGLYDYAQLPGKGNRNVSLAAHRNGRKNGVVNDHAPFYYIDTLQEGDYMYLRDSESIYRYEWHSMEIVAEDDWGPIYSQGFSCLTLTSCHPIGISTERIIVRGKLSAIYPYDQNFVYKEKSEEIAK